MAYIVAAVVLIGLVSLLNLALTYGVIRRLRQHNDMLGAQSFAGSAPVSRLSVGAVVDDFKAVTVSGGTATRDDLSGHTLVGFFSPDCPACTAEIGRFVEVARSRRDSVWAVAVGEPDRVADTVATLIPAAGTVIAEDGQQEMISAFGVAGFPAFFVMGDGGAVQAIGIRTDEVLAKISA
ncbi:redoxin domain-containing protein [Micromonospora sp. NPDC051196]|uniref:redoxin domain-containing protein n=1 Tax=Micromonospora sp. NPDC051196 TaxID=3155281 RepID=UPI0034402A03